MFSLTVRLSERSGAALRVLGWVAGLVGVVGLVVARSVDFAGRQVALLGIDAGFTDDDRVTRRWELKFLWFNPMWALLTIAGAVLLVVGVRRIAVAWVGIALFGTTEVIVFASETFVYAPDDESLQRIGTASNTAFWAALALAGAHFVRRIPDS